jgi:hypothetical protein
MQRRGQRENLGNLPQLVEGVTLLGLREVYRGGVA